jgi:DNA-binding FadR family transcriptional regulator
MSLLVSALASPTGAEGDTPGTQVGGIAERIATAISLGMLAVGERLPPEAELASQFSIAVATLRKALATLRARGVVETRRGRNGGTFVVKAPFPESDMLREALRVTRVVALRDFADEHAAISGAAARLATERTPSGHATRLAELAFRAREARDGQERSMTDSRFHIEVAVLSHSPRLLASEQRLQAESSPFLWCDAISRYSPHLAFTDHLALTMAIEQGRAADAQRLAEEHVMRGVRRIIEAKLTLPPLAKTNARDNKHPGDSA